MSKQIDQKLVEKVLEIAAEKLLDFLISGQTTIDKEQTSNDLNVLECDHEYELINEKETWGLPTTTGKRYPFIEQEFKCTKCGHIIKESFSDLKRSPIPDEKFKQEQQNERNK